MRSYDPIVSILVTHFYITFFFFFCIATLHIAMFYGITNSSTGEIFGLGRCTI